MVIIRLVPHTAQSKLGQVSAVNIILLTNTFSRTAPLYGRREEAVLGMWNGLAFPGSSHFDNNKQSHNILATLI